MGKLHDWGSRIPDSFWTLSAFCYILPADKPIATMAWLLVSHNRGLSLKWRCPVSRKHCPYQHKITPCSSWIQLCWISPTSASWSGHAFTRGQCTLCRVPRSGCGEVGSAWCKTDKRLLMPSFVLLTTFKTQPQKEVAFSLMAQVEQSGVFCSVDGMSWVLVKK